MIRICGLPVAYSTYSLAVSDSFTTKQAFLGLALQKAIAPDSQNLDYTNV